jgi:hypothetical protein
MDVESNSDQVLDLLAGDLKLDGQDKEAALNTTLADLSGNQVSGNKTEI